MTIKINKNTTAATFQAAFSTEFPNLKLAFFRQNTGDDIWSSQMVLNNQILLGEISDVLLPQITTENLTISANMTVAATSIADPHHSWRACWPKVDSISFKLKGFSLANIFR